MLGSEGFAGLGSQQKQLPRPQLETVAFFSGLKEMGLAHYGKLTEAMQRVIPRLVAVTTCRNDRKASVRWSIFSSDTPEGMSPWLETARSSNDLT